MRFVLREMTLRDGTRCMLRSPGEEDAAQAVALLKRTLGQTHFLTRLPDEVTLTPEKEAEILRTMLQSERETMIGAFVAGQIVGTASVSGVRDAFKLRHRAGMGIAVDRPYWRLGIGTALMQAAVESAQALGYAQLELGVYADNARAIALYERFGFERWGCVKNAFRLPEGTFCDEILMGRML